MASPQVEDGYTRISNELLEAVFRFPFNHNELRILLAVLRHTYGWSKKKAQLSLSFLATATGIPGRSVVWSLKHLREENVISREGSQTGIQKDYSKWRVLQPMTLSPMTLASEQVGQPMTLGQNVGGEQQLFPNEIVTEKVWHFATESPMTDKKEKEKKLKETASLRVRKPPSLLICCKTFSFEDFMARNDGQEPAWSPGDYTQLAGLVHRKKDLTLEDYKKRWLRYVESKNPFDVSKGMSLRWFSTHFDSYTERAMYGGNRNGRHLAKQESKAPDPQSQEQIVAFIRSIGLQATPQQRRILAQWDAEHPPALPV